MNLRPRQYYYNSYQISKNPLVDEKREKMINYAKRVTKKNLGMEYTSLGYNKVQDNDNNYNLYPYKMNRKKDDIYYEKINNDYSLFNKTRSNYHFNERSNPSISNNLNFKNDYFKRDDPFLINNDYLKKQNHELWNDKPNIRDKNKLNAKTEISKVRHGTDNRYNNFINNYTPNINKIDNPIYNTKLKDKYKHALDQLNKDINDKWNLYDDLLSKNGNNILGNEKLINKYNDDIKSDKNYLDDYKNKLNIINDKNKEKNINENNFKKEENKEIPIVSATKYDYLEMDNEKKTTAHGKSNINRSRSVAPTKNIVISEISKITKSLTGFNNLGATCYMNSALQNIIHCKIFIEKIINFKNSNNSSIKSITNSFLSICSSLIDNKNKDTHKYLSYATYSLSSISPSNFKSNFCLKHKDYMRGQHDSIEFLRTLLDDMSKEININQNISAYKELTTEGKSKDEQNKEYHNFFISRENSLIIDIFYNQIINIFTCSCKFESYSFQKLLDIPLLLPNKKFKTDLSSLIKEYFKEEEIEWGTKCENCQKPGLKHFKKIKFSILNEIVIFSLQRFDPFLSMKNNLRVSFDEIIDLKDYCDIDLYKENTKYRLCGTINHIGNINYGHYYTYIRIDDIWYEFNDSIVKKIINMDYDNSSVCVLFYEKI
jgi:ubiquitin C-terminal hydrolase